MQISQMSNHFNAISSGSCLGLCEESPRHLSIVESRVKIFFIEIVFSNMAMRRMRATGMRWHKKMTFSRVYSHQIRLKEDSSRTEDSEVNSWTLPMRKDKTEVAQISTPPNWIWKSIKKLTNSCRLQGLHSTFHGSTNHFTYLISASKQRAWDSHTLNDIIRFDTFYQRINLILATRILTLIRITTQTVALTCNSWFLDRNCIEILHFFNSLDLTNSSKVCGWESPVQSSRSGRS